MSSSVPGSTRVDHVASVHARIGWKALTAAEYTDDGFAFLATPNIKSREIDFDRVNYISTFRYNESPELKLQRGDVLLAKDGSTLGITNVVRDLPRPATVNGSIAIIRPRSMNSRYLTYVLQSAPVQAWIAQVKDGMGVPHLFQADIKKIRLPNPPAEIQRRIADFLDDQVARIDNIIAARREQIDRLREVAVADLTSDLFPDVDSLMPISRMLHDERLGIWGDDPVNDGTNVLVARVADFDRPVFRLGDVHTERMVPASQAIPRALHPGDTLLERSGGTQRNPVGCPAYVEDVARPMVSSNFVSRLRPVDGVDGRYLSLLLGAMFATRQQAPHSTQTTGIQNLDSRSYLGKPVPVRTTSEQRELSRRGDGILNGTRTRTSDVESSVTLLTEYKQSLITAAVTGEFDVIAASGRGVPA